MNGPRAMPLVLWTIVLAGVTAGLIAAGTGQLATPPIHGFGRWVDAEGSVAAAMAIARLVGLVLAVWLLATTLAAIGARLLHLGGATRFVDALTLPVVRRMVHGAVGVGVVVGAVTSTGATAYAARPEPSTPTMVRLPSQPELRMERLPDAPPDAPAATPTPSDVQSTPETTPTTDPAAPTTEPPPPTDPAATPPPDEPAGPAVPSSRVVVQGDHFWRLATEALTQAWQRPPTDDETVPYWEAVIAANRDVLADPANPNLLFPGQQVQLPPPPPPPPAS